MPHMAATGVSGLDLYVRDDEGKWRWLACALPTQQTNSLKLISGIPDGERTYMMFLPLYNGVATAEIGIPKGKMLATAPPDGQRWPPGHLKITTAPSSIKSESIRDTVVAPPGYWLLAIDCSVLELRTLPQICLRRYG